VETPVERALLRAVGCDEAQGYLFARPLTAEQVGEYAARGDARAARGSVGRLACLQAPARERA
jgi:predicted signal transduction protein with EAL and GGDEF domain